MSYRFSFFFQLLYATRQALITGTEVLYKINAFRNATLAEELQRALQFLGNAGITTIPLS